MKTLKYVCYALLVLIVSVFDFYSFNLVFSVVSNYQTNILPTGIAFIPMFMFMLITVVLLIGVYYYNIKQRRDSYFVRQYSIICGSFALVGLIFSILAGKYVYHGFTKPYIFDAYPLWMHIIHALLLGIFTYLAVRSIKDIKENKPKKTYEFEKYHNWMMFGIVLLVLYSLEKLGAFTLLPMYYSTYDSAYVIPFYIQLLVPAFLLFVFLAHRNNVVTKKVSWIMLLVSTVYSVFSLIYIIAISHNNYPLTINPLSPVQQLERLVTMPIDTIVLYAVSLILPIALGIRWLIIRISSKKGH